MSESAPRIRHVEAIAEGTVIDHIPPAATLKVAQLLSGAADQVFIGINLRSERLGRKGVVKIAGRELDQRALSSLALIAPGATVSIIRDYRVVRKFAVPLPERFEQVARCANANCITNHEQWPTRFVVVGERPLRVRCWYCERAFPASELALL
ncbi:MAG: aspartate carbamoyltransferase regulatory subunit [Planctomycetota bacterium]|nr:aspartate carbamoyltransferase regulatory subunit [Planctomycetota bacterium]MCX8039343.1 aspartate carbamoyltransferase regulatory subunit [Planctomycetota bacterium]MDW8373634.1 aspartate carbamoyltransferase regulatory subunit [Planctomycetota bacterium]